MPKICTFYVALPYIDEVSGVAKVAPLRVAQSNAGPGGGSKRVRTLGETRKQLGETASGYSQR